MCVGVCVALDMLASRKQCRKALARKKRLARARRRRIFVQRTSFLYTSAVHVGIELLFTYQISVDKGKKFSLVG